MRMLTTVLAVVIASVLACCSGCDDTKAAKAKPRVEVESVSWVGGSYELRIRFNGRSLVDEKIVTAPGYPVIEVCEYFGNTGMGWTYSTDVQTGFVGTILTGTVYEASVSGADTNAVGWGVLPQNRDGSFVTMNDPGSVINMNGASVAGVVTADNRANAITYTTECDAQGLTVTIDGVSHFYPKP